MKTDFDKLEQIVKESFDYKTEYIDYERESDCIRIFQRGIPDFVGLNVLNHLSFYVGIARYNSNKQRIEIILK